MTLRPVGAGLGHRIDRQITNSRQVKIPLLPGRGFPYTAPSVLTSGGCDMKTAMFPAVVAAKKAATQQLNYYRSMMAPPAPRPGDAGPKQGATKRAPSKAPSK